MVMDPNMLETPLTDRLNAPECSAGDNHVNKA